MMAPQHAPTAPAHTLVLVTVATPVMALYATIPTNAWTHRAVKMQTVQIQTDRLSAPAEMASTVMDFHAATVMNALTHHVTIMQLAITLLEDSNAHVEPDSKETDLIALMSMNVVPLHVIP